MADRAKQKNAAQKRRESAEKIKKQGRIIIAEALVILALVIGFGVHLGFDYGILQMGSAEVSADASGDATGDAASADAE